MVIFSPVCLAQIIFLRHLRTRLTSGIYLYLACGAMEPHPRAQCLWKGLTAPRGCVRCAAGKKLTVFLVVENLEVLFDTGSQCFLNVGYRVLWRQRPVQEITHRRPLHHLRPAEAGQAAEAVAAVDDVALALLSIGHQETPIWNTKNEN